MNIQQMMMQAQKMQRELRKAMDELAKEEFVISKGGAIIVTILGDKTIKAVHIDDDAFEKENKEMVEEMIAMAINEGLVEIKNKENALQERITGRAGGLF